MLGSTICHCRDNTRTISAGTHIFNSCFSIHAQLQYSSHPANPIKNVDVGQSDTQSESVTLVEWAGFGCLDPGKQQHLSRGHSYALALTPQLAVCSYYSIKHSNGVHTAVYIIAGLYC